MNPTLTAKHPSADQADVFRHLKAQQAGLSLPVIETEEATSLGLIKPDNVPPMLAEAYELLDHIIATTTEAERDGSGLTPSQVESVWRAAAYAKIRLNVHLHFNG